MLDKIDFKEGVKNLIVIALVANRLPVVFLCSSANTCQLLIVVEPEKVEEPEKVTQTGNEQGLPSK